MNQQLLLATGLLTLPLPLFGQTFAVSALDPGRHALAVPRAVSVNITMSEAVNPASAGMIQVNSLRAGGKKVGQVAVNGSTITFNPTLEFQPGETVQVTVPATVRSTTNLVTAPQVYQFTTAAGIVGSGGFVVPALNPDPVVDSGPASLQLADIDGDGDLDLLMHCFSGTAGTARVNVRVNSGQNSGNFVAPATNASFTTGTNVSRLALGDIDGDSDLDLLATGLNGVVVRLNNGVNSGSFVAPATGASVSTDGSPLDVALGDVDGDGDLDLLTANPSANTVGIRLNSGLNSGSFTAPTSGAQVTTAASPLRVLLGDVDNDGDLDLVAVCSNNTISIRLNRNLNSGVFVAAATNADISVGPLLREATLGDVNGDGNLDLVLTKFVSITAGLTEVWLNDGTPRFALFSSVAVGSSPQAVALGDVDGDGDLDMVVGNDNRTNRLSLRLNGGVHSGTFFEPLDTPEPALGASFPWSVALADVNGDGNLDLLCANNNNSGSGGGGGTGTVSVRLNQVLAARTSLAPTVGNVGALVRITGTDFTGVSAVSFNGVAAPANSFTLVSPTVLHVAVPAAATTGPITVATPRGVMTSSTRFLVGGVLAATTSRAAVPVPLYPNPAHYAVWVQVPRGTQSVTLVNTLGQVVRTVAPAAGATEATLPLAGLPAGVYVVRVGAAVSRLVVE